MKKSKIIALLTACAMAIGTFVVPAAAAAEDKGVISAEASKTSLSYGDEFDVTVNLDKNPGLSFLELSIKYDDNVLELKKVVPESLLDDSATIPPLNTLPFTFQWYGPMYTGEPQEGVKLATLTFKVIGIGDGKTQIAATVEDKDGAFAPPDNPAVDDDIPVLFENAAPITVPIAKKQLTINGITATSRAYDGTKEMSISGGTLDGIADGHTVTAVVPTTGTADSASVGKRTVTFGAITLEGADKEYYIAPTNTTVEGEIKAQPITIASVKAENKVYDGKTAATVTEVTFDGLVGNESLVKGTDYVVTATFDNANVGEGKTVTATVTLKNGGNNYSLAKKTETTTATINKAAKAPTPSFAPAGGDYTSAQNVTITSAGANIYYTTDGSEPTTQSTPYSTNSNGISVGEGETTIKAIATSDNYEASSDVAEATYNIVIPKGPVYNPPAPPAVGTPTPAPAASSETPTQPTEEPGSEEVPATPGPTLLPVPEPTLKPDGSIYYDKTNDSITVDDKGVELPGVKVAEQNYFKIRDIAYILNGSGSQFEIVYDNATRTISITTGKAYTPIGTETKDGISNAKGVTTSQHLVVDGKTVEFHAYNIGGSNYVRIRDIAIILGLDVQYDDATGTVKIITEK
jgi:hypothetical protein